MNQLSIEQIAREVNRNNDTPWTHIGGDLEARLSPYGDIDIRVRGDGARMFLSKKALHAALDMLDD